MADSPDPGDTISPEDTPSLLPASTEIADTPAPSEAAAPEASGASAGSAGSSESQALPESFDAFEMSPAIRQAIAAIGWQKPTPVQARAFEPIASGHDVLVQSHTGSGKTGAFILPWLASRFEPGDPKQTGVQLLVLTPTRELAKQVCGALGELAADSPVVSLPIYGGTAMRPQLDALRSGVHAVVGTPGRILDHIRRRTLKLHTARLVVLDEADEMLSMGFLEDIHAILDACPKERQNALFSATVPPDIERIARRYMRNVRDIRLSGDDTIAAAEIIHTYYTVPGSMRVRDLLDVIGVEEPATGLIFCNTREETNVVANVLRREGYAAEPLSSDLTQAMRERVMGLMRQGKLRFLVATDVASRGIDIEHISHVINFTFPENAESYVHRTGRTGRAGRTGQAISLIAPQELGNFYYLKLQYPSITFNERHLPPASELEAARLENKLDLISKRFPDLVSPEWTLLARQLAGDPRGEQVIAFLLSEAMSRPIPPPSELEAAAAEEDGASGERDGWRERRGRDRGRGRGRDRDDRGRGRDRRGRDDDRRSRRGRGDDRYASPREHEDEPREHAEREAPLPAERSEHAPRERAVEAAAGDAHFEREGRQQRADAESFGEGEAVESFGEGEAESFGEGEAVESFGESEAPEGLDEGEAPRKRRRRRRRRGRGRDGDSARAEQGEAEPREAGDDAMGDAEVLDEERQPGEAAPLPPGVHATGELEAGEAELERDDAAEVDGAVVPAPAAFGEIDATEDGARTDDRKRRRRRRRRRKPREGGGEEALHGGEEAPREAAPADDTEEEARSGDADEGGGRRRRRRRQRGRGGKKSEVAAKPISQAEIVIDIDEQELEIVRGEFGEIDELDDLTLKGRRRGVIDALEEEVELEDLSDRDDGEKKAKAKAEAEEDGEEAADAEGEADEPAAEQNADADADADADGDETDDEKKKRRRRRRRRKKKAEDTPPELTAPPHKDFWEVWAAKFSYKDFEDAEPEPEPEPEVEAVPARRRERERDRERERERERPRREAPRPIATSSEDDGEFIVAELNIGRAHDKKAAHIRELLATEFDLAGKAVRNLTVMEAGTRFEISETNFERLAAGLAGFVLDGVALAIARHQESEGPDEGDNGESSATAAETTTAFAEAEDGVHRSAGEVTAVVEDGSGPESVLPS